MDTIKLFTTFVRVADAGSISQAARALGLSVAMASRHLRALEEDLGAELVRRTTRRLALTDAGVELLPRARALLASVDEARAVVRPGRGVTGSVVVSLPVSFGLGLLNPMFPALLTEHPRLALDLRFEDRLVDLLSDGVDLAIRAGVPPPDSPFVVARRLVTVRRVLCASPAFLRKHGAVKSPSALAALPCLPQGPAPTRWRFETEQGVGFVEIDGRMRSNNVLALREAALTSAGIAQLPEWLVREDFRAKRLVHVLPALRLAAVDVYGLYPRGSKGLAVRAVLEHLARELPSRMLPPGDERSAKKK